MIYVITLYYNGLIQNTVNDLPYQMTTDIDKAIEIANAKLANPKMWGNVNAIRVSITTWESTETRENEYKYIDVCHYNEQNVTFGKNKYGICENIPE